MNIKEEKDALRKKFFDARKALNSDEKRKLDHKIQSNILSLWHFKKCRLLITYVSMDHEAETLKVIKSALGLGKDVAVPYCIPGTSQMEFFYISSLSELHKSEFGVLEPDPSKHSKVTDFSDSLCLVPGLCFDQRGYRLGYGKGYYDRFFADYQGFTVGLCYEKFIERRIVVGRYDRKVHAIVTERAVKYIIE